MNAQSIVRRAKNLEFSRLDEANLAIDAQAGYCYNLNPTSIRIWEIIDRPISIADVCARLRAEYAVDEASCQRDVLALAATLQTAGLLEISSTV